MDDFILKILSGPQAGAEVVLAPGEYSLGCGDDDDLQFNDLSLEKAHAHLRVTAGAVEISSGAGSVVSENGLRLEPDDTDWREIEQLDVISVGMVRFAVGAPTAQWTSIIGATRTEAGDDPALPGMKSGRSSNSGGAIARHWPLATAAVCFAALLLLFVRFSPYLDDTPQEADAVDPHVEFALVQAALSDLDFAKSVGVRQEVDGEIYVSGYVETLAERRAVARAVGETGVPAKLRLWVLSALRNSIDNLIESIGQPVDYDLSDSGDLTLKGVIIDNREADRISLLIRDQVIGLHSVESEIKTASHFLHAVRQLARRTRVGDTVFFRIDGSLIEASGVIPSEKIDIWAGFVEAYIRKYADHVPLRSYVQLAPAGDERGHEAPVRQKNTDLRPIVIGKSAVSGNEQRFDIGKFRSGDFAVGSLFAGRPGFHGASERRNPAVAGDPAGAVSAPGSVPVGRSERSAAKRARATRQADSARIVRGREVGPFNAREFSGGRKTAAAGLDQELAGLEQELANLEQEFAGVEKAGEEQELTGEEKDDGFARSRPSYSGLRDVEIGLHLSGLKLPASGERGACGGRGNGHVRWVGPEASIRPSDHRVPEIEYHREEGDYVRLVELTRGLIDAWSTGRLQGNGAGSEAFADLAGDLDRLAMIWSQVLSGGPRGALPNSGMNRAFMRTLLPGIAPCLPISQRCWPRSRLTRGNLGAALFWLDLLAISDDVALAGFQPHNQMLILEAGLNPRRTADCAREAASDARLTTLSAHMSDNAGNPAIVRAATRQVLRVPVAISGANIAAERFIQFATGEKFSEGAAPTANTRVLHIGELGTVFGSDEAVAVSIYRPDISWLFEG